MTPAYLNPELDHPAYHIAVKLPKYNGHVNVFQACTPLDAAHVLRRNNPQWTKDDHLRLATAHAAQAARARDAYSELLDEASMEAFGRPFQVWDYRISAIGCDEFSDEHKDALRKAAHAKTHHLAAARAHAKAANPRSTATV